jgi:ribosome-binding ATPase YchF (GTP1/OBG family)
MRAAHVRAYVDFITQTAAEVPPIASDSEARKGVAKSPAQVSPVALEPDEETKQTQQDELEALSAIFPDEFRLLSAVSDGGDVYQFPICYQLHLDQTDEGMWPPHPLRLEVTYPSTYPQSSPPHIRLAHDNNVLEFSAAQREACLRSMQEAALLEEGMPCVYSCYAAAKEFFESGVMGRVVASLMSDNAADAGTEHTATYSQEVEDEMSTLSLSSVLIRKSSKERIQQCNQQGLNIAASLLEELGMVKVAHQADAEEPATIARLKGGLWLYTIGLVGKPSAGKSTFFNAATAFARQRDDADNLLGGATMAPRPFTTIDPNVGFCLVPAPTGLCPEDDYQGQMTIGSTHGRDHLGRRLLPVLLKDVAGLVPGAYQGRGRGNKFLNDLTDADVLVHVLDASGTADVEGYDLGVEEDGRPNGAASHPLNDMEWIRTELIEWVHANLMHKWDSVKRKGRSKLMGMFSGYGQSQGLLWSVLDAVEKYLEKQEGRDHALDRMDEWDEGDLRRLVSTFLGVRFPMALALNKIDLPTSPEHIRDIQTALPVHGAYTGIPLSARSEMIFIRRRIEHALAGKVGQVGSDPKERLPEGVWSCLKSALSLYEPVLVFPVIDFTDYAPLPGLNRYATSDPSLPSVGMVTCLEAAGGRAPSLWDPLSQQYHFKKAVNQCLRDVLIMKPGSTVDDVFLALKNRKALEGDLIRAEAASEIGSPSRPVPKHQIIDRSHRILKIMTTKKASWQQNHR